METTKLLAINFESKEVANVLDKGVLVYKNLRCNITVSEDCTSLAMAIVDCNHQIKAQCKFKLEELGAVSKTFSHPWELLKTPKSIKVSIICCLLKYDNVIGIRQEKVGYHIKLLKFIFPLSTHLSINIYTNHNDHNFNCRIELCNQRKSLKLFLVIS